MAHTGGAWLSSARVVRCWVKSRNERNPRVQLPAEDGDSGQTAGDKPEEGGDDVKSSCPFTPGLHTYYNGGYREGARTREGERTSESPSQFGSKSATRPVKPESLVIADQHAAVNTFSGLVHTARQTMGVGNARSRGQPARGEAVEGRADDWG